MQQEGDGGGGRRMHWQLVAGHRLGSSPHDERLLVAVVGRDGLAHLCHSLLQLLSTDEQLCYVWVQLLGDRLLGGQSLGGHRHACWPCKRKAGLKGEAVMAAAGRAAAPQTQPPGLES